MDNKNPLFFQDKRTNKPSTIPFFSPSSILFSHSFYTIYPISTNRKHHSNHTTPFTISYLGMGRTALTSKPTIHDKALNNMYKSQKLDRSTSNVSYAASDIKRNDNGPRSPVSPLESNGETWRYPHATQAHPNRLRTLYEIPLQESPQEIFFSRPMSYYDSLQASPEPTGKEVFADLVAAPPRSRLSRPFDQPQPVTNDGQPSRPRKLSATPVAVPMQANMTRAGSFLRRQPQQASFPKRKPVPAPLTIPASAHQSRRQREPAAHQESQHFAQRPGRHQGTQTSTQRTTHKGWNPLEEPPRQQRTAHAQPKEHCRDERRGDDVEKQAGHTQLTKRSGHRIHDDKAGILCKCFLVILFIMIVVIIAVVTKKAMN